MRRRKPDSMEVQQMKAQAKEEKLRSRFDNYHWKCVVFLLELGLELNEVDLCAGDSRNATSWLVKSSSGRRRSETRRRWSSSYCTTRRRLVWPMSSWYFCLHFD